MTGAGRFSFSATIRRMADDSPIHTVFRRMFQAFLAHWKAHNNAYPKLIKLPPEELPGIMVAVDGAEMPLS